ncbi:S26 family signal peptidase [Paenarthrobacter sp. Z7-10]|uniref:S26 family signal peptidase n=1 Tax=Paenarthrobacter sp. Z7-10 TaxID=2787635 RepID=UPI0022A93B17|nr:S26 family signal peptidase [Paenarthrobacter sp. Z7-10]MCZ2404797.1 S26 family signal peptidase [Paenarthrobacter sp. Z7-10]
MTQTPPEEHSPATDTRHRGGSRRFITLRSPGGHGFLVLITATILVGGLIAAAVVFALTGGRWFIVATPSMGTSAPVASLVLTTRDGMSQLRAGDVITFHPPTAPEEVYTHRIQALDPDGTMHTQGDINGAADPWVLHPNDVIGRSILLPGLGWLVKAIPILLIGVALLWILTRLYTPQRWRPSLRITGLTLVIAIAAYILKPFVAIRVLATGPTDHGATAAVVSTGLLPIRVHTTGGSHVDLVSGAVGELSIPSLTGSGHYQLASTLHLSPIGWILIGLACSLPLLWCLIIGLPPTPDNGKNAKTST